MTTKHQTGPFDPIHTQILIQNHIPIPAKGRYTEPGPVSEHVKWDRYPWSQLQVGDSFAIPLRKLSMATTLAHSAKRWAKKWRSPRIFTVRTDLEANTARIWRIK